MLFKPAAASNNDNTNQAEDRKPRYKALKLFNVDLFARCDEASAKGWIRPTESGGTLYPVTCLDHSAQMLTAQPIILNPDGSIWKEGTLFLLNAVLDDEDTDPETIMAMAGHLADFMQTLATEDRSFLDFSGYRFERPSYIYKEKFKLPIQKGSTSTGTANGKIRTIIKFYRYLMESRNFTPKNPPWKIKHSTFKFEDAYGYERTKHVIHTDLTYPTIKTSSLGNYICDDGKLTPLTKYEQEVLLQSLIEIGHPEMLLVFIIALVTGMRIQTILTLRVSSLQKNAIASFDLIPIRAGRGSVVDTKRDKPQTIQMPAWLHHKLNIYVNSERFAQRRNKSQPQPPGADYIFVSNTGMPYYIAKCDRHKYESTEKGSYVRSFIAKYLKPKILEHGCDLNFSFHDLRATFGMNLVEERREMLNRGKINMLQLVDYVRKRMNHSSSKTTQEYLNFQQDREMLYQADYDYQQHILEMWRDKL